VDQQEAALVVVSIEQRQLLMTVLDIDRVVDIERYALGRRPGAWKVVRQPAAVRREMPIRYSRLVVRHGSR
jgi:hypothetical protein